MSQYRMMETTTEIEHYALLSYDPDASLTSFSSPTAEARRIWGRAVARSAERTYEERVLSAPGVLDALDEAVAEIKAMENSP